MGIGIVAQGIDFKTGDNIIIPEREHWNNTFPWLNLEQKGVEIRFAKINEDNSIDTEAIEKLIETWYNRKRRHSTLGYKTIEEFEILNNNQKLAA